MSSAWTCFSKTFGFFDVYTQQPKLRSNGMGRFTSCCGVLLSFGFLLTCLLLFVPRVNNYVKGKYLEQSIMGVQSGQALQELHLVTGRDIFMALSVRLKNTTEEVDITDAMNTFMTIVLTQVDQDPKAAKTLRYAPTEPCPPNYLSDFDGGVSLKYCWKPVDGVMLDIYSVNRHLQFSFLMDCKMGISCTGAYMSSIESSFNSFWQTHTFTYYFTNRYLDENNTVRWRLNKISSFDFFESPTNLNYAAVYLTNDFYYIDDSVMPNRQNRTVALEGFLDRALPSVVPLAYLKYYGVGALVAGQLVSNYFFRYYTKLDAVIGMLGGGIFLIFTIYACVGYRSNRYRYRLSLVERLYLDENVGRPKKAELGPFQRTPFLFYNMFTSYDPLEPGDTGTFKGKLQHYRHMFQRVIKGDTNIINLIRQTKIMRRLLKLKDAEEQQADKQVVGPKRITEVPQSAPLLSDHEQQQVDLMGWNEVTYNYYEDIIKRDDQPSSKDTLKHKQLTETDAYKLVFEERRELSAPQPSQLQIVKSRSCWQALRSIISFCDVFKVQPRFRFGGQGGKEKSPFVGILTIIALILAVLLLVTAFGYFVNTKTRVSLQTSILPLDQINFTVTTDKKYFSMAICFLDATGAIKNMVSTFNTFSTIEFVQHFRNGTDSTQQAVKLTQMGNPLTYFNDDGSVLTSSYGNCYAIPLGQNVTIYGSPKTQEQAYFSIRVRQECQSPSQVFCAANTATYRANTLSIFATPMLAVLSKSLYNPSTKDYDTVFGRAGLLRQRSSQLNSSVVEQISVDWNVLYNDTSISRDGGYPVRSTITNQQFYEGLATVLPNDGGPVSYELTIRPSGRQIKVSDVAMKADEMFAMIGGVLLFVYFIVGLLARPYREYLQRIKIAQTLYKTKDSAKMSFCDELAFYLNPFKSLLSRRGKLGLVKSLNEESEHAFSIETIIERNRTCMRIMGQMQSTDTKKHLSNIYLKQPIRPKSELRESKEVANDGMHQIPLNGSQVLDGNSISMIGSLNQLPQKHVPSSERNINEKFDQEPLEDGEVPEVFDLDRNELEVGLNSSESNRADFYKASKVPLKRSIHNSGGFRNFCRNLFSPQNSVSRYTDLFGIEGESTLNGSARYGSVCGGVLTALCSALIIGSIFYFAQVYTGNHNFISTLDYVRVAESNNPFSKVQAGMVGASVPDQKGNNHDVIYQNFTTGTDLRLAIGFLSGKYAGLQDVSTLAEGPNRVVRVIGVEAQINRTDRSHPVYSEQIYPFQRCQSNYLNDNKTFKHEDFNNTEDIKLAYCVPDNVNLQLAGDSDTDFQRWFYVSVAMVCNGCTAAQLTAQRLNAIYFFGNYTSKLYLSDPIVYRAPIVYNFQQLIFGKISSARNTVENVSIDSLEFKEDKYVLNPPDTYRVMDYRYLQSAENNYYFNDLSTLFKNMTFSPTGNLSRYTMTYLKADQILGMIGGFAFFIILIFRCFARRHNKYKMALDIGSHLFLREGGQIVDEDSKQHLGYVPEEFSEWEIFKFSTFSFLYKNFSCLRSQRFLEAELLMKNAHDELDLVNYLKVLNYCRNRLRTNFILRDKYLIEIPVKHVIRPIKLDVDHSQANSQKLEEFAQLHQLSPYEKAVLAEALEDNTINLAEMFGKTAIGLSQIPKKTQQRKGGKPARKIHLEPIEQHSRQELEHGHQNLHQLEG